MIRALSRQSVAFQRGGMLVTPRQPQILLARMLVSQGFDFHKVADEFLSDTEAALEKSGIEDAFISRGTKGQFDITSSSGVLTIKLGDIGSWVLNKQSPNKQIWWSSPLSGPRRFEFDSAANDWKNVRDGSLLKQNLRIEMEKVLGVKVKFPARESGKEKP